MKYQSGRNMQVGLVVFLLILASIPVWAGQNASIQPKNNTTSDVKAKQPVEWKPAHPLFIYTVVAVILLGSLLALALIRAAVIGSTWSLADALSEEVEVTQMVEEKSGAITTTKPVTITKMCASTSRLIALMGMVVILLMFLGFGALGLYSFGMIGELPDSIEQVIHFLLAGLALFAPYVVNKFSTMFESFFPKKG
jgi:hypothetical protein